MAFPVIKYCLAIRGELEAITVDSDEAEEDTGDGMVGFGESNLAVLIVEGGFSFDFESLLFDADGAASAKSSGKFKARNTSTMSS